jgi:hypothetical protein
MIGYQSHPGRPGGQGFRGQPVPLKHDMGAKGDWEDSAQTSRQARRPGGGQGAKAAGDAAEAVAWRYLTHLWHISAHISVWRGRARCAMRLSRGGGRRVGAD